MSHSSKAAPLPNGSSNENPSDIGFWALVLEDYRTHDSEFFNQGFWAVFWHRFGNARMSVKPRFLRLPLTCIYGVMRRVCQWLCGIKLDYTVKLGRRVKLEHFGGMILGARAIGNDVILRQNTTMGIRSTDDLNAKPTIGDRVSIGAGAVIVGDVTIGSDSIIGANCVVSVDIPAGSFVRMPKPEISSRTKIQPGN